MSDAVWVLLAVAIAYLATGATMWGILLFAMWPERHEWDARPTTILLDTLAFIVGWPLYFWRSHRRDASR